MGLNNIFAWGVGIYLICIKHPFSFIIIVGSILELVFIIYYFGKEWIRLTKDD